MKDDLENIDRLEEVISHAEMTIKEGLSLQRGMNYRPSGKKYSIFLMSVNENAPYNDGFNESGDILTYEGHNVNKREQSDSIHFDQPMFTKNGKLTENGHFFKAVEDFKTKRRVNPEKIHVYEKIATNVWSDKGLFYLVDVQLEKGDFRKVFKFKLIPEEIHIKDHVIQESIELSRRIPTIIKRIIWERDRGKCVECGSNEDLHYDHILPYSKGGTSTNAENIQLLCQKHNLYKSDKIL